MHRLAKMIIAFAVLTVFLLILVLAIQKHTGAKEKMTKIRRTVGTANEADEIPVAPGVVNSLPIMDYTYTYWDGGRQTSCDECPNAVVCPKCPQFANSSARRESFHAHRTHAGERQVDIVLDSPHAPGVEDFEGAPNVVASDADDILPPHDLSHERASGVAPGRQGSHCGHTAHTHITGDTFNSDRGTIFIHNVPKASDASAMRLLYADTMMLDNPPPSVDQCEWVGTNGYVYCEPCNSSD